MNKSHRASRLNARPPMRVRWKYRLLPLVFAVAIPMLAQPDPPLEAARRAMETRDYAAAEQLYRKALAQTPASINIETALALSLQLQGRSAEAIHYYSLALKQRYVPETYALLAEERCKMEETEGLRPMLDRIYKEEGKNARVLSAVAPCYLNVDKPIESVEVYHVLLNSNDYPPDLALIQLGKSYIRSGQFFAAQLSKAAGSSPYLVALRQAPSAGTSGARSAFPQAAQSSTYFSADLGWPEAVERWRQHPEDAALLYLAAVLSAEEGMRQIETCDERYPASPYLEQFHADVLADQGQTDQAAAEYEQLLREHPNLPDLGYSLGLLHEKRGEWDKAAQAFRQQLVQTPKDERALSHLSQALLQMGQYADLRDLIQPQMNGEHPPQWASLDLAEADQKLGHPDAAIRILTAAEREPNPPKLVHYRLMTLYTAAARTADAKREYALFQAASKHEPDPDSKQ